MTLTESTSTTPQTPDENEQYQDLLASVRRTFDKLVGTSEPLFTTRVTDAEWLRKTGQNTLFDVFLYALPPERRQHYTCRACRDFVERYGGLVVVNGDGTTTSPIWDFAYVPPFFRAAVEAVRRLVERAPIAGVFLPSSTTLGTPKTAANARKAQPGVPHRPATTWHHLSVLVETRRVFQHATKTADQAMAEHREEFKMLVRALDEFKVDTVRQAHTLLVNGQLPQSTICEGVAKWLLDLHERLGAEKNERVRSNVVWRAVATAPAGWCHVRSTMIGTLLEDIAAGLPFEDVRAKFAAKVDSLQYQRPTAAPGAGLVAQAEKEMAARGPAAAKALERRFATLADVLPHALWAPKRSTIAAPAPGGVFGHLRTKETEKQVAPPAMATPAVRVTWEKFRRTVLPTAERIEVQTPYDRGPFHAMVTAAHDDAAPIIQWDHEGDRNPFTWYTHSGGSPSRRWGLMPRSYYPVAAVVLAPYMWQDEEAYPQHPRRAFFLIEGARDLDYESTGGFFGNLLKADLHPIKRVLEAYMMEAPIQGKEEASACGLPVVSGQNANLQVRVTAKGGAVTTYLIDRWD